MWSLDRTDRLHKNIAKLLIIAFIYGFISINYIDLIAPCRYVEWYHIWLAVQYFIPFIVINLLYGIGEWEIVGSLGLIVSLMNDLFYYVFGKLILGINVDLIDWYLFQLGFKGWEYHWWFQGGIFTFPVYSWLMGLSIYLRIITIGLLMHKWINYD